MNLESWLRQDHSLPDQLKVIEGLCSALNEAHARGTVHRGLEPANVEVESDGRCDLTDAVTAAPSPRYRAPELAEGGGPSPQSDIYSAGVIFYEMLGGRPPSGDRPSSLADLRPDVSRDLTDAVMGCLEKGPDWRPKDLSYLLQVVGTLRAAGAKGGGKTAARAAEPSRSSAAPKSSPGPARRGAPRGGSRSNLPLVAAVLVLALGGGAGYWMYFKQGSAPGSNAPTPAPGYVPPTPVAAATPTPPPIVVATPRVVESKKPEPAPTHEVVPVVNATPTPRPAVVLATPEPRVAATPTPVVAVATPPPTPPPPVSRPAEPTLLTAISPLSVHRGGTTMLDLRGSGLRPEQQARIVRVKEDASGITVVRQKFVDPTLIKVLVNLDARVPAGAYAVALTDSSGALTNSVSFTVAK